MNKIQTFTGALALAYTLSPIAAYAQNMVHTTSKLGETIFRAKNKDYSVELVGHVNKEGESNLNRVIETIGNSINKYEGESIPGYFENFNDKDFTEYISSELEASVKIAEADPKKMVISKHPGSSFNKIGEFKIIGDNGKEYTIEGRMAAEAPRFGATFNTKGLSFYVEDPKDRTRSIKITREISGPIYEAILENALKLVTLHETTAEQRLDEIVGILTSSSE